MFDIGWTEMLVIAVVLIVVVGPKDLPKMLRTFGRTTAKLRSMAGDFQRQFNEALKEAELEDVKKSVDELRSLNPANEIKKHLNPFEKAAADVRSGLESLKTPSAKPAEPAAPVAQAAEPLKNGATAMPGVAGPETMPPAPVMTPLDAAPAAAAEPAKAKKPAARKPAAGTAPKASAAKPAKAVSKTDGSGAEPKALTASKPRVAAATKAKTLAVKSSTKTAAKTDKKTKANAS